VALIQNQQTFFNIHTPLNLTYGEIRGQLLPVTNKYVGLFMPTTVMSSPAFGVFQAIWDPNTMRLNISQNYFRRLSSTFSSASLNGPVADPMQDGPAIKSLSLMGSSSVTEGMLYGQTDMFTDAQMRDLRAGRDYVNIASTGYSSEIRASLRQSQYGQIEFNSTWQTACSALGGGNYLQICVDIDGMGLARAFETTYMDSTCMTRATSALFDEGVFANRGMHPMTNQLDMLSHFTNKATAVANMAEMLSEWNTKCPCGGSFASNVPRMIDRTMCGPATCSILAAEHMGYRRDASMNLVTYNSRDDYGLPQTAFAEAVADAVKYYNLNRPFATFMKQSTPCRNTVAIWPQIALSSASSLAASFGPFVIAIAFGVMTFSLF